MEKREPSARELLDAAIQELLTFNYKSRVDHQHVKKCSKILCAVMVKLDDEEPMIKVENNED